MKVLPLTDPHCGHMVGLTPPKFQKHDDLKAYHRKTWNWFEREVGELGDVDALFLLGDLIDGKGDRSGGTELTFPDTDVQCEVAIECIDKVVSWTGVPRKNIYGVYGTPYHVNPGGSDLERRILNEVGGKIGSHEWIDVNGTMFDIKHKVGGSTIPHGRATALLKEDLWNLIWSTKEEYNPRSQVILRGHIHYYMFAGDAECLSMSLPALQGPGSKFGKRQCSGTVNFGFVHFDVEEGGYSWEPHILKFKDQVTPHKV